MVDTQSKVIQIDVEEVKQKLARFDKQLEDTKSIMRVVLSTKKHEYFIAWAETLEQALMAKIVEFDHPKKIANYIRLKLVDAGLEDAVPYMYEVLPSKFKEHQPMHRQDGSHSEILMGDRLQITCTCGKEIIPNLQEWKVFLAICPRCQKEHQLPNYEQRNARTIILATLWKQAINLWLAKLKTGPWEEAQDPEQLEQMLIMEFAQVQFMHESLDDRESVFYASQHELVAACLMTNTEDAGTFYFNDVKNKNEITRKQTGKIVGHLIPTALGDNGSFDYTLIQKIKGKLHIAFEPINAFMARKRGWFGHPCPTCGNWRVKREYQSDRFMLQCKNCKAWWDYEADPPYANPNAKEITTTIGPDGKAIISVAPVTGTPTR